MLGSDTPGFGRSIHMIRAGCGPSVGGGESFLNQSGIDKTSIIQITASKMIRHQPVITLA